MKRVLGLALFCIAVGITLMLFIENMFIGILLVVLCLLIGYQMFFC